MIISSRAQHALDTHDVFIRPYLDEASSRYLHLHNMGNTHEKCIYDSSGNVLDAYIHSGKLDASTRELCDSKDTRMIAPAMGNTAIVRDDPATQNYITYLQESGLLAKDATSRMLPVSSFTDYDEILRATATSGRIAIPYAPTPDFFGLCRAYGVPFEGANPPPLSALADKHAFREFVAARQSQLFDYPRLWLGRGAVATSDQLAQLDRLIAYATDRNGDSSEDTAPVLFVQKTRTHGGVGNFIVRRRRDGTFHVGQRSPFLATAAEVARFVHSLDSDVEISPYFTAVTSPSFGIFAGTTGVSCIGPFTQLLGEHNEYVGFTLDQGERLGQSSAEATAFLYSRIPEITRLCLELGEFQRHHGYVGYSGVDVLVHRDSDGEFHLTPSELNLRFTATCMLQMIVHAQSHLRDRFLEGQLSLLQYDHMQLSGHVIALTNATSTGIARLLTKEGIPVFNTLTQRDDGVILMQRPVVEGTTTTVAVGVIAGTDHHRDELAERVVSTLGDEGSG